MLGDVIPDSLAEGSRPGVISGEAEGEVEEEDDDGAADGVVSSPPLDPQPLTASTVPRATVARAVVFHDGVVRPDAVFRDDGLFRNDKLFSDDEVFRDDDNFHDRLFIGSPSTHRRYIVNYAPHVTEQ